MKAKFGAWLLAACLGPAAAAEVTVHVATCGYAGGTWAIGADGQVRHVDPYPWCATPLVYSPAAYYVPPGGTYYIAPRAYYVPPPAAGVAVNTTWRRGTVHGRDTAAAGYNAWTGNAGAARTVTAYDAATGTRAVGQRGGGYNAHTGDYAYGERGAAYNERTGVAAAGGHATVGNAATGREAEVGRVGYYDPRTGRGGTAAGVRGENGGVARVGNKVFVGRDGNVRRVSGGTRRRAQ